jgi:hypothetical protein
MCMIRSYAVCDSGVGVLGVSDWRGQDKGLVSSASRYECSHQPSNSG